MKRVVTWLVALALAAGAALGSPEATDAQYFGRNQVRYDDFDFRVLETPHFRIYFYEEEAEAARQAGRMAERWYARLARVMDHEFTGKQPLVLYANHTDFRQTNAILGQIGEGTGGVTEPLKRRIVLPMAGALAETDHVIGHELVHGFQFDLSGIDPRSPLMGAPRISRLPLWMMEGMAEYLSTGPRSTLTSMWMRDAVAGEEELPGVRDLVDSRKYFPYRWGHALWAYIAGRWGDTAVREVFLATVKTGSPYQAIRSRLGIAVDTLSRDWKNALRDAYGPVVEEKGEAGDFARPLVTKEKSGTATNLGPALSPDGDRLIYLSEKSRFSLELYLADAETGEVIRQITETAVDPHYQSLQFINSAGSWSPDGQRFALGAVTGGTPVLSILNPRTGETVQELRFPELGEIFNPTWSPDGDRVAFVANNNGYLDLYVVDLGTERLRRLTDDPWAQLHPDWSPDGSRIAFVTDRFGGNMETLEYGAYRLAAIDPAGGEVRELPSFPGVSHLNPKWSPDGGSLYFVSDRGGIPNLYRVDLASADFRQLTDVDGGISGVTQLSPALSVASESGRIVFSAFENGNYHLYRTDPGAPEGEVEPLPEADRSTLLPPREREAQLLAGLLDRPELGLPRAEAFTEHDYRGGLALDYVSQPTLGFGISTEGSFVGGGATLHFSDMLGNQSLTTLLQFDIRDGEVLNGIGALASYRNRDSRWTWGGDGGQIPRIFQFFGAGRTQGGNFVTREVTIWQVTRVARGVLSYPFSPVERVEFSGGFQQFDFEMKVETDILGDGRKPTTRDVTACSDTTGVRFPQCDPAAINLATASAAYVYDNSVPGPTGPIVGQRARLEASPAVGDLTYLTGLVDGRKYVQPFWPVTFAGQLYHFGRYGGEADDPRLSQLFLGSPALVRGYGRGTFDPSVCEGKAAGQCEELNVIDRLFGTRVLVGRLEMRVPLFGPLGLAGGGRTMPPLDFIAFTDGGFAWTGDSEASFLGGPRDPVTSAGLGLRANLLGFAVGELAWVHPFDRPEKGAFFTFNFVPIF